MSPSEVSEIAARRSIHPVWKDVGGTFFKQGFLQGYYWGRSELTSRLPLVAAAGFLIGFIVGRFI